MQPDFILLKTQIGHALRGLGMICYHEVQTKYFLQPPTGAILDGGVLLFGGLGGWQICNVLQIS